MKKSKKIEKYDIVYMVLVTIIFSIVYFSIIFSGKMYMFLDIGADTYCSYWPSIAYAKDLLFDMKLWDMKLGLGASTMTYISYFLSDPFNWVCFFFKKENIDIGIFIGLILKNVCLAYYAYRYIDKKGICSYKKIICSLMIVFCGWFVGWGQHYNFATVFVCYIAILYYFECWLQEKRYVRLVLATAFLAINSPYYCYMTLLFLVFYYFISMYYFCQESKLSLKEAILHAIKTAGIFLIGIGCAGLVFLPYMSDTLASPRVSGTIWPSLKLGNVNEYFSIILRMFSNSILGINGTFVGVSNFYECPFMYVGVISVLLLPLFLIEKKIRKKYRVAIISSLFAFVFLNFSAPIFNAFSTKSYRWTYLFVPVFVGACGKMLEVLETKSLKKVIIGEVIVVDAVLISYYIWYLHNCESNVGVLIVIGLAFLFLNVYGLMFAFIRNRRCFYILLLGMISIDLCVNAYISVHKRSLILSESKESMNYFDDSNEAIEYLKSIDSSFYRISKNYGHIDLNDSMFQDYYGEKFYSSILSAEMWDMMDVFDLRIKNSNYFYGFDDKQILRNLTAGKYRFTKEQSEYYGHQLIENIGDIYIYENEYASNFGVLYDSYVLREEIDEFSSIELQSVLLDHCIIENEECDEEMKKITDGSGDITTFKTSLIKEEKNIYQDSYVLNLQSPNEKPLILEISGENLNGSIDICTINSDTIIDSIPFFIKEGTQSYYIDNLNVTTITLNNIQGVLNEICLYEIETEELNDRLEAVNRENFKVTSFTDMYISGYTECDDDRILFLPIPYNKNWEILVNNEITKVYKADIGFMATIIPQGHSEIVIRYNSQMFLVGSVVSIISIIILIILGNYNRKRKGEINEKKRGTNARI